MVSLGIGGWLLSACSSSTNTNALNRERSATSATGPGHAPPPSTSTTRARPVSSTSVPPTTSPVTSAPKTAPSGLQYGPGPQGTYTIEPQPPAGSCHYTYEGSDPLPDLYCTPGALNPLVTQSTIASTICRSGYTSSIRPPESVTEPEKHASASAYSYTGAFSTAEYDHLVPLELGGDPNDPANLWVEPNDNPNATSTTNSKDVLENRLNNLVCSGQLRLATAQEAIASNWVAVYRKYVGTQPLSSPTTSAAPPPTGGASCTASHHRRTTGTAVTSTCRSTPTSRTRRQRRATLVTAGASIRTHRVSSESCCISCRRANRSMCPSGRFLLDNGVTGAAVTACVLRLRGAAAHPRQAEALFGPTAYVPPFGEGWAVHMTCNFSDRLAPSTYHDRSRWRCACHQ